MVNPPMVKFYWAIFGPIQDNPSISANISDVGMQVFSRSWMMEVIILI
jgi:hypothetical protein